MFSDSGQPEKRNGLSSFPRLPNIGSGKGNRQLYIGSGKKTSLPEIVERKETRLPDHGIEKKARLPKCVGKLPLVATSQEQRNYETKRKVCPTAHTFERHRKVAPGRLHPNRGKRLHGTVDSDLEQTVPHIGGHNSKPPSKQKLRKRRRRVKHEGNFGEEELSSLEKLIDTDSPDKKWDSPRRRHKSHVRENTCIIQVPKDKKRIQSCDRSLAKPVQNKSLTDVKEDFRNPKSKSEKQKSKHEENTLQYVNDNWKQTMDQHRAKISELIKNNHQAELWEEMCRLADNFKEKISEKQKASDDKTIGDLSGSGNMESIDYSCTKIKYLKKNPCAPRLNKDEKIKVKHFTKIIKDKVQKKSTEILLERNSDDKNNQLMMQTNSMGNDVSASALKEKDDKIVKTSNVRPSTYKTVNKTGVKVEISKKISKSEISKSSSESTKTVKSKEMHKIKTDKTAYVKSKKKEEQLKSIKRDNEDEQRVQYQKIKSKKRKTPINDATSNEKRSVTITGSNKAVSKPSISKKYPSPGKQVSCIEGSVEAEKSILKNKTLYVSTRLAPIKPIVATPPKMSGLVSKKAEKATITESARARQTSTKPPTHVIDRPTSRKTSGSRDLSKMSKGSVLPRGNSVESIGSLSARCPSIKSLSSARCTSAKPSDCVSARSTSAKLSGPVSARCTSTKQTSSVPTRCSSAMPSGSVSTRSTAVKSTSSQSARCSSAKPLGSVAARCTSAKQSYCVPARCTSAKSSGSVSVRSTSVNTTGSVSARCSSANISGSMSARCTPAKQTRSVQARCSSAKSLCYVSARSTSANQSDCVPDSCSSSKLPGSVSARNTPLKLTSFVSARCTSAKTKTSESARCSSEKSADCVLARSTSAKQPDYVSAKSTSAKSTCSLSTRRSSAKSSGRVSARCTSSKSTDPLTARCSSMKPSSPASSRCSSVFKRTPVSARQVSDMTSTPSSARPRSVKPATALSTRPTSVMPAAAAKPILAPVSSKSAVISRRPASAQSTSTASIRQTSAKKASTELEAKKASTELGKRSSVKSSIPMYGRTTSAGHTTPVIRRPASVKPKTPRTNPLCSDKQKDRDQMGSTETRSVPSVKSSISRVRDTTRVYNASSTTSLNHVTMDSRASSSSSITAPCAPEYDMDDYTYDDDFEYENDASEPSLAESYKSQHNV